MPTITSYATVRGSGRFPIDMLRYDRCYPADGHLGLDEGEPYEVRLAQVHDRGLQKRWTPQRWASFGWTLTVESGP